MSAVPSFLNIFRYLGIALAFSLLGCTSMQPQDFEGTTPTFTLEQYFAGRTKAWGVVHDRSGALIRQFVVDLEGVWNGSQLTLTEDFHYSDGKKERRIWNIQKIDDHTYQGTAADVVGIAIGKQYGQALNWSYDLRLPVDGSVWTIRFDDWMYLQPDNVLINRAVMTKWGMYVGEISIFFRKEP